MTPLPLHILYQDDWLVAIDKPAGYLVHPTSEPKEDDLVAMKILRDQIGKQVHTIHRLDRPTSGVLLFGLEKKSAHRLHKELERGNFEKTYWAVVRGKTPEENWECREPLQKEAAAPVRDAHTGFRLLGSRKLELLASIISTDGCSASDTISLVEATPHTGRFHQIRRHLLHQGTPIVGDFRYAGVEVSSQLGELLGTGSRMLLQSKKLQIDHPVTGERIVITAPVDDNFCRCFPGVVKDGT